MNSAHLPDDRFARLKSNWDGRIPRARTATHRHQTAVKVPGSRTWAELRHELANPELRISLILPQIASRDTTLLKLHSRI